MPADVHRVRFTLPRLRQRSYAVLMKTITNALILESSDAAQFRLHVLEVYQQHGWKAAVAAFKIGKSTLYDWRKRYQRAHRSLSSLVPSSTRPHRLRRMTTDPRIVAFIVSFRETYGNIGKEKLKAFLDEYARHEGIASIAPTTIGKIITRKHLFWKKTKRYTHKAFGAVTRVKAAPKETRPGYLEMDSLTLWVVERRWYFVSLIDVATKVAHVEVVPSLSSRHTSDVLKRFIAIYQAPIRTVQTDNGSEFLGDFHAFLEDAHIPHQFIYPRSPRINGCIERFNRTVQEECIQRSEDIFYDIDAFKKKLHTYLFWYNTKRPHHALKLQAPLVYLKQFTDFPECR